MTTIEELKYRIDDPEFFSRAEARANKIDAYIRKSKDRLHSLEVRIKQTPEVPKKLIWIRKATEVLAEAAKGNTYCHNGCSGCCHMPTHVSLQEAELIAKETGAPLTMPERSNLQPEWKYNATPCSFLKDGACSIYDSRPVSCRIHYVVHDNDELCQIHEKEAIKAPHYNTQQFQMLYAMSHFKKGMQLDDVFLADIRAFFPQGLNT